MPALHESAPQEAAGAGAAAAGALESQLLALPTEVLRLLLRWLPPPDVRSVGGTCRVLRGVCRDVMPGLKLNLFPHQVGFRVWIILRY